MSIRKDVWVKCDRCSQMDFASHTSKQARSEARKNGWVFRSGKDYCTNCAPTLRATDAEKSATSQAVFEAETLSTSDGFAVTTRRS